MKPEDFLPLVGAVEKLGTSLHNMGQAFDIVADTVTKGLLSVNEAREQLGMKPIPMTPVRPTTPVQMNKDGAVNVLNTTKILYKCTSCDLYLTIDQMIELNITGTAKPCPGNHGRIGAHEFKIPGEDLPRWIYPVRYVEEKVREERALEEIDLSQELGLESEG